MRRREFVFLIGGAAILSPVAVVAEEHARKRQVGLLSVGSGTDPEWQSFVAGFTERLRRLGWPEDRVAVHARFSDAEPGRLEKEAAELVARSPDVIVVGSPMAVEVLKGKTSTIPIVFANGTDPVGLGFVKSLAHPGGNITGFASFEFSMGGKSGRDCSRRWSRA